MAITKPPRRYALFANYSTKSVVAILATLNSEVLNVRASTSVTARTEAVELFSDRSAKIDFLLTPVELSSCGLNLQKPCHRGLIVQFPFSANSLSRPFAASSAGPDVPIALDHFQVRADLQRLPGAGPGVQVHPAAQAGGSDPTGDPDPGECQGQLRL